MKNKKLYISLGLLILFIIITLLVRAGSFDMIDNSVHAYLVRFTSEVTTNIMKVITFFGSTLWMVILTAIVFIGLLFFKKNRHAYVTLSMIVLSTIMNNVVKIIIKRPRPTYMPVGMESSYAYPSGHTMASVTLYGLIMFFIIKSNIPKKYKWIYSVFLGLLIILIAISRIYLGAHYFTDVIGGALLSSALLMLFSYIQDKKSIIKQP